MFVELRGLNDFPTMDLFSYIHRQWSELIPTFNAERLDYGLRTGKFILLLDGLDEVDYTTRDNCCKQIMEMTYKFPECPFLISSRPDERFSAWNEYFEATILPFTKPQVNELIQKISFDDQTKRNFLKQINEHLYNSHENFLSNPLLCTMMLMTFNEFEEMPTKIYIFYQKAFEYYLRGMTEQKPSSNASSIRRFPRTTFVDCSRHFVCYRTWKTNIHFVMTRSLNSSMHQSNMKH